MKAAPYERSEESQGYRNGARERPLTTQVGRIILRVPRLRNGAFSTELFSRYQRSEQALVRASMEMVVNGISLGEVTAITEELCQVEFSKSTVHKLFSRLGPIVETFENTNILL